MKLPKWRYAAVTFAVGMITMTIQAQNQTTPPWAYALNPPAPTGGGHAAPAAPPDTSQKRVPGSSVALTLPQTRDLFKPPDWYPDDHPSMPDVVGHGRRPDVPAGGSGAHGAARFEVRLHRLRPGRQHQEG